MSHTKITVGGRSERDVRDQEPSPRATAPEPVEAVRPMPVSRTGGEASVKTIDVHTELPTTADAVWQAMQHAASFLYVNRGLFRFAALAGRTAPVREGEKVTGWIMLFHLIPLWRHTIGVVEVDQAGMLMAAHDASIADVRPGVLVNPPAVGADKEENAPVTCGSPRLAHQ